MALAAVLAILTGLFGHDTSLASPTPPEDWIRAEPWADVRGEALEPVTGGSSWPAIRGR